MNIGVEDIKIINNEDNCDLTFCLILIKDKTGFQ